jgi:hypothetical protein
LIKEEKILLPQGPRLQPPLLMLLRRVYLRPIKSLTNPNPRASSAPSSEREREREKERERERERERSFMLTNPFFTYRV